MNRILELTPQRLKMALIALPFILTALYYLTIAADRYVSTAIVTVRQANQDQGNVPGVAMLLGGVNPPSRDDTLYLREYIHSLDLMNRLNEKLDLRAHYQSENLDLLYRSYAGASQERFLEYYRSRVEVSFDDASSLLKVRVQGFEPEFAQKLNRAILDECEKFVNEFSQRMARQEMAFAETEMQRAANRLRDDRAKVLAFQTRHKLLDPAAQAQATGTLTAELQAALARQETELRTLLTYLSEDSFQVRAQRSQVEATRAQIEQERLRATTGQGSARLNNLVAEFQELTMQASFAQDSYKIALAATENARIEASRKLKSLVVIEPPSKPETAEYPRRLYNLVTLLVVSLLVYGIFRLVLVTIREHLD